MSRRGPHIGAIFASLERAANVGALCPTNRDLGVLTGLAPNSACAHVRTLERAGLIAVERFGTSRIVTILATGRSTATPAGRRYTHWRDKAATSEDQRAGEAADPLEFREGASGQEVHAALHAEAARRGMTLKDFLRPVGPNGTSWLCSVRNARRVGPVNIARVNALLADRPVPPATRLGARRSPPRPVETQAPGEQTAPEPALTCAERLRAEVFAENRELERRRTLARVMSNSCDEFLALKSAEAPRAAAVDRNRTARPAASRDPCPRCGTRGDLGCKHRAPLETYGEAA